MGKSVYRTMILKSIKTSLSKNLNQGRTKEVVACWDAAEEIDQSIERT